MGALSTAGLNSTGSPTRPKRRGCSRRCQTSWARRKRLSVRFNTVFEVVTPTDQKLGLASTGTATLSRPDKIRFARSGGFADYEILYDGKTLTFLGKNANLFTQVAAPGTVDQLIDTLQDKYNRPVPGADLLMTNSYDELMQDVYDSKDLGSGVINGVECDTLAFRKNDVDWQIWIAQGDRPYPCQFVITSKLESTTPNTPFNSPTGNSAMMSRPMTSLSKMLQTQKRLR